MLTGVIHFPIVNNLVFDLSFTFLGLVFHESYLKVIFYLTQSYVLCLLLIYQCSQFFLLCLKILNLLIIFLGHHWIFQFLLQVPYLRFVYFLFIQRYCFELLKLLSHALLQLDKLLLPLKLFLLVSSHLGPSLLSSLDLFSHLCLFFPDGFIQVQNLLLQICLLLLEDRFIILLVTQFFF